jgi:hypothetical protein
MSSPLDRTVGPDEPSLYAPKWIRDAAHAAKRDTASTSFENFEEDEHSPFATLAGVLDEDLVIERFRLSRSLEPATLPELQPISGHHSVRGALVGLALAIAVIAFMVVGKPWTSGASNSGDESNSFSPRFQGQTSGTRSLRFEWAGTPVREARPKANAIDRLDSGEIATLLKRGDELIARGDLAAARLVLQGPAEAGDARAALALAGTYDPIVLEKIAVHGFAPNIAMARDWYERADQFGAADAPQRLKMLASRRD